MAYQKCRKCGIRYKKSKLNKDGLCSVCEEMGRKSTQKTTLNDWINKKVD